MEISIGLYLPRGKLQSFCALNLPHAYVVALPRNKDD